MKTKLLVTLGVLLAALFSGHTETTFTKITTGAIVVDQGEFTVGNWGDFSGSGFLDLFVCNYDNRTNVFYHNNGDGTFTKVAQGNPVSDAGYHVCPAAADFDNDGYLDLLVSAGIDAPTAQPNLLFHNNGDATFSRVSGGGVTNFTGFYNACAVADYDNDGFVDLFIPGVGGHGLLFHNNGNGTFTRVVTGPVATDTANNTSVSWADYDNDGFMDLLVNNTGGNYLYHNNRDGTFTHNNNAVATDVWLGNPWGSAWGDYDNDGFLDLFITGMTATNRLYHNNGNGVFTNVISGPMLKAPPGGGGFRACAWGDYDNDGYLDLFLCGYNATNRLFHNNGDGTFTQVLGGDPVQDSGSGFESESCGWADYDNDGFLDLFMARLANNGTTTTNFLYHNNGNGNAWLEIKLVGTVGNRSAIGAKVRVHTTIGGKTFWQLREINSGGGRWIQPLVAHFGLGDATNADIVRIEWPSGLVQEFPNVTAKQILTYAEPPRLLSSAAGGVPQFSLKGGRGFQYEVDSSPDLSTWSPIGSLTITNLNGIAQIVDTNPSAMDQRFYRAVSQ